MNPPDIGGGLAPPNFPFIRGGGAEGGARGGRGGGGRRRTRRRERRNRRRRERRRRRREGRQFFGDRLWWQTLETKERERERDTDREDPVEGQASLLEHDQREEVEVERSLGRLCTPLSGST